MPCRVGITTDPLSRRIYWNEHVVGLRNWLVVSTHKTKSAAQRAETECARQSDCVALPGGDGPERATWSVYRFTYDRVMG